VKGLCRGRWGSTKGDEVGGWWRPSLGGKETGVVEPPLGFPEQPDEVEVVEQLEEAEWLFAFLPPLEDAPGEEPEEEVEPGGEQSR
jgi:hypothetical protein